MKQSYNASTIKWFSLEFEFVRIHCIGYNFILFYVTLVYTHKRQYNEMFNLIKLKAIQKGKNARLYVLEINKFKIIDK